MKTELQIGTLEEGRHDLAPQIDWSHMGCRDHFVQFYENDSFLVDSISGFIGAGFRSDEADAGNDSGAQGWNPFLVTAFATYTIVPEPGSATLVGFGLAALVAFRRRK